MASSSASSSSSSYSIRRIGPANTEEHAVYIQDDKGSLISAIHDVPLYARRDKSLYHMVVTVPRWTNAKMKACLDQTLNPIRQEIRRGKLRYVRNTFPHHGHIWNYGILPQNPAVTHPETKKQGDNYCLDVCEIGEQISYTGAVKEVKILGAMALIDGGSTDWKLIAIDVNDPFAHNLNGIEDVESELPGFLRATNEWFRVHEIPDGKMEKFFAFTGECKNKSYTEEFILQSHGSWRRLVMGQTKGDDISLENTSMPKSPFYLTPEQLPTVSDDEDLPPAKIKSSIDKWFFFIHPNQQRPYRATHTM